MALRVKDKGPKTAIKIIAIETNDKIGGQNAN